MITVRDVVESIGRDKFSALGLSGSAISMAIKKGQFPSYWYAAVQELGNKNGLSVPQTLFYMFEPESKKADGRNQ